LAGEAWDRCQAAREAIATHGITYVDRFKAPRARARWRSSATAMIVGTVMEILGPNFERAGEQLADRMVASAQPFHDACPVKGLTGPADYRTTGGTSTAFMRRGFARSMSALLTHWHRCAPHGMRMRADRTSHLISTFVGGSGRRSPDT